MRDWKLKPFSTSAYFFLWMLIAAGQAGEARAFQGNMNSGAGQPWEIGFERMWPSLQQPWYFSKPRGVASDGEGYIYVADYFNHCIQKFSADGRLISKWGKRGSNGGEFDYPRDITVDKDNVVYVTDSGNNRVQKFDANGRFLHGWGKEGNGDGEFHSPAGIEADSNGSIYVVDSLNFRVQRFDASGKFIEKWGREGVGAGEFGKDDQGEGPEGIAVDGDGFVYVADTANSRIQKFDSRGRFLAQWGESGAGDARFVVPFGLVARGGSIFVLDSGNGRIQEFDRDGRYLGKFGGEGGASGEFIFPYDMAFDASGNAYVADSGNNRIQKLARADGGEGFVFLDQWRSGGIDDGFFRWPAGVATDRAGNVYVCDTYNHRIQKFDAQGRFLHKWGTQGSGVGEFSQPFSLAADSRGALYVVEPGNHRIQKFDAHGVYRAGWGDIGDADGLFQGPRGVAVDRHDNVYVADTQNNRIQKFSPDGAFIAKWGSKGDGPGEFDSPYGVAIGIDDLVYVADTDNDRIQKFTPDGRYVGEWGEEGAGRGQFDNPYKVAVGGDGSVFVADTGNDRIQVFSKEGDFFTEFGEFGSGPGQLNTPNDVAMSHDGRIYVVNTDNHRIEVFSTGGQPRSAAKAIVVAGGGPYYGNNLWETTQRAANNAYWTLNYKGFTRDSIYYLSADTGLDLDQNGKADDVDLDATNAGLREAVAWAADAESVIIYLVDHGGKGSFRMNDREILAADELDAWLDKLQEEDTGPELVTVVYDACESGSFIRALVPSEGKKRIVITSASPEESAYFVTQGAISFSSFFWANIFNGLSLGDAFTLARDALGHATASQNPLLDDNGNGIGNEEGIDGIEAGKIVLGNGVTSGQDAPRFEEDFGWRVSERDPNRYDLQARVTDLDGISRVWALIRPSGNIEVPSGGTIRDLPSIDLLPAGDGAYVATSERLLAAGIYQTAMQSRISLYGQDLLGNTAGVLLDRTPRAGPTPRAKAIIVATGRQSDPLWPAIAHNSDLAYRVLSFQGYSPEDIYFLRSDSGPGVDDRPDFDKLAGALERWAVKDCGDLVLYLIGNGCDGTLRINERERLMPGELDQLLDNLQQRFSGRLTILIDASLSGGFLGHLTPPPDRERIVIAGTAADQPASFEAKGVLSFSGFFWKGIFDGLNVWRAFQQAKNALFLVRGESWPQVPLLDDNGNGVGSDGKDGLLAASCSLGAGIRLAGDPPIIGSIQTTGATDDPSGITTLKIKVDSITTTGTIDKVWAVIEPPRKPEHERECLSGSVAPALELEKTSDGGYAASLGNFTASGAYRITVYARDGEGNISLPVTKTVLVGDAPKPAIDRNAFEEALLLAVGDPPLSFVFEKEADQNWFAFQAKAGEIYAIRAHNLGDRSDIVIELYDKDGDSRLGFARRIDGLGRSLELEWACPKDGDGLYHVAVRPGKEDLFGPGTEYDVHLYHPAGSDFCFNCMIAGYVRDVHGQGIAGAEIVVGGGVPKYSDNDGYFLLGKQPGTYTITVGKAGYGTWVDSVHVPDCPELQFILLPTSTRVSLVQGEGTVSGTVPTLAGPDGEPATITLVDGASHGQIALNGDGTFNYIHNGDGSVSDGFSYYITTGGTRSSTTRVDLDITRRESIAGRVTDGEGKGIAMATVEARSSSSADRAFHATTDRDGYYRIGVDPASDYRVAAWSLGPFQTIYYDNACRWSDAALVDASAGSVHGVDFVLPPGSSLSGRVTNLGSGDKAIIEAWSPSTRSWSARTLIGAGGALPFTIDGLAPAGDYEIAIWASGYTGGYLKRDMRGITVAPWDNASRFEAGESGLDVSLAAGRSISGRIVGLAAGEKATLTATSAQTGFGAGVVIVSNGSSDIYRIDGLAGNASDYRLSLRADSGKSGFYTETCSKGTNLVPCELAAHIDLTQGDREDVDFFLSEGGSISGMIYGLGKGIGAVVEARSRSTWSHGETLVMGGGSGVDPYTVSGLRDARDYRVRVRADGYQGGFYAGGGLAPEDEAEEIDVPGSRTPVDFSLKRGTAISGVITGLARGMTAHVEASSATARGWGGTTAHGLGEPVPYAIDGLPSAGDYVVRFLPQGGVSQERTSVDSTFSPTGIHFTVSPGRSLSGTLSNGPKRGFVQVSARSASAGAVASVSAPLDRDGTGNYSLTGLPGGKDYMVWAVAGNSVMKRPAVDLSGNDAAHVDFVFPPVYPVTGEIVGLGTNVPVRIAIWNADQAGTTARLGNGGFVVDMPAGLYRGSLHAAGYRDAYFKSAGNLRPAMPSDWPIDPSAAGMVLFSSDSASPPVSDLGYLDLSPYRGYKIHGYVYMDNNGDGRRDSDEEGLAGVFVEALSDFASLGAFSNSAGYYEIAGLAVGEPYMARIWSTTGTAGQDRRVVLREDTRLDIGLSGLSMKGIAARVVKAGSPVVGATVLLFDDAGVFMNALRTDEQGRFSFPRFAGESCILKIDEDGDGAYEPFRNGNTHLPIAVDSVPPTIEMSVGD